MVKKLNIFYLYLIGDLVLITISLYLGGFWLINTQVAFIASLLIVFASYFGYKKFIKAQIPNVIIEDEEDSVEEKEEKFFEKSKKIAGTFKGALSPLRLIAYLFLVLSFFFLRRHGLFMPLAFLVGLGIVPTITLLSAFFISHQK